MAVTATISAQVQNMITARFALAGDMGGQPSSGAGMIRQGGLGLKAPDLNVDGMLFGTFVAVGSAVREIHLVDRTRRHVRSPLRLSDDGEGASRAADPKR